MIDTSDPTYQRIVSLLYEQHRVRADKVHPHSRLAEDFGMDGDDADEFMEAYFAEFNVNADMFQFERYFGPEAGGCTLGWLFSKNKFTPITVEHLFNCAKARRWS